MIRNEKNSSIECGKNKYKIADKLYLQKRYSNISDEFREYRFAVTIVS